MSDKRRRMQGNPKSIGDGLVSFGHHVEHNENHACGLLKCIPVAEPERSCDTCRYENKLPTHDPCCRCSGVGQLGLREWQPKREAREVHHVQPLPLGDDPLEQHKRHVEGRMDAMLKICQQTYDEGMKQAQDQKAWRESFGDAYSNRFWQVLEGLCSEAWGEEVKDIVGAAIQITDAGFAALVNKQNTTKEKQ